MHSVVLASSDLEATGGAVLRGSSSLGPISTGYRTQRGKEREGENRREGGGGGGGKSCE